MKIRKLVLFKQKTGGGTITDLKETLTESENSIYEIVGEEYFLGDNETNEEGFDKQVILLI